MSQRLNFVSIQLRSFPGLDKEKKKQQNVMTTFRPEYLSVRVCSEMISASIPHLNCSQIRLQSKMLTNDTEGHILL